MSDPRLLLCTDLDRTLLPNGTAPESPRARACFGCLAGHPGVTVVYVTGRNRALVERAVESYCLPLPAYVISDVGTNIYAARGGELQVWPHWTEAIAPDWNGLSHGELRDLFADLSALRPQERAKQNVHKLSYYVPLHADRAALTAAMEARLERRGVRASLVWSVDEPAGVGLLDILPRSATKLHAIEFLRGHLEFAIAETLFAGDSGNDLPVLASHLPAVLVANATPEVQEAAQAQAAAGGRGGALYLATGGYLGMNGNYSAGILEGLAHYRPEFGAWIQQQETCHAP